ncbi:MULTISPECIES: zinc-binding dehydrogenase [Saccharopolyspora]|uniref:quinone oxidoreductase family protein n=1 Tax=Saccharopolyspora TaxID=1835 RepID=UPI001CD30B71|nr:MULTISPECIES: zinc-binding dehydrogenase [unclassified Saccharopolyspora]MCA1188003.1 zinc-binding dehydrogenase [Saccharopolyspora sp. 6T]MCA1194442.1 zinc-binding dehydrogenase [Saccharopolyspora sp. 6V]MCA1283103.1 zinc-binding dehydrogenase [Saccharopolyspora sp. 7B]
MKAAVYYENGGPDVLRYADVPDPEIGPGEVLLRIEAVGVQGGDLLHRQSAPPETTPHVVGYQAAGTVAAVGEGVTGLREGQRAVAFMPHGSHAELAAVPEHNAYRVPDDLDPRLAAGIPVEFGTADDCLFEFGRLRAGEVVLVQAAAGGVGLAAVQLAAAAGATVLGTASSAEKLARLGEHGLHHAINYREEDVAARVAELTDGRGVDLVVDPVGGRTLESSVAALAYRGRISWVGQAGREPNPPRLDPLMFKSASLNGVYFGGEMAHDPARTRALIERLIARVAAGELTVVVDREFPLAEAAEAHRHIEGRGAFGRVLLIP